MTRAAATAAFLFSIAWPLTTYDDCQGVMQALVSAQRDANSQIDVVNTLEAAISAPSWDPVSDGWMVDAHEDAIDDLVGYLNTAAIAEEAAHAAHCY